MIDGVRPGEPKGLPVTASGMLAAERAARAPADRG
jgi:hypothetical protein